MQVRGPDVMDVPPDPSDNEEDDRINYGTTGVSLCDM